MGVVTNTPGTEADRDAYLHFWLVVGHLLGVDFECLRRTVGPLTEQPLSLEELRLIQTAIYRRHARNNAGGHTLMAALLEMMQRQMRFWFMKGYPAAMTRRLIGDVPADMLGVPPAGPTRVLFDVLRPVARAVSPWLQGKPLAALGRSTTRKIYQDWIDGHEGQRPPWRIEPVREQWGLKAPPLTGTSAEESVVADAHVPAGTTSSSLPR
jgi:hypothetical protein